MGRLSDLVGVSKGDRETAEFWFIPLHPGDGRRLDQPPPGRQARSNPMKPARLQYWPDTISWDSGETGWSTKNFPGLSHGLVFWTHGGNPTVSFDIKLTSDTDPAYRQAMQQTQISQNSDVNIEGTGGFVDFTDRRNIDVSAATTWFNALQLPRYRSVSGPSGRPVEAPPVIQLVPEFIPLTGETAVGQGGDLNENRSDLEDFAEQAFGVTPSTARGVNLSNQAYRDFYCVVTDISTDVEQSFVSGAPRIASISISLMETIQVGDQILPHDRGEAIEIAKEFELSGN